MLHSELAGLTHATKGAEQLHRVHAEVDSELFSAGLLRERDAEPKAGVAVHKGDAE